MWYGWMGQDLEFSVGLWWVGGIVSMVRSLAYAVVSDTYATYRYLLPAQACLDSGISTTAAGLIRV